jgi:hypothetical protein
MILGVLGLSASVCRDSVESVGLYSRTETIAKNQNTYAKRQREMEKKVKADAKRARRLSRKQESGGASGPAVAGHPDLDPADYAAYFPPEPEPEPEPETEPQKPDEGDSN